MGYTMATTIGRDGSSTRDEVRYTEWPKWVGDNTKGSPDWSDIAGRELYNHSSDPQEGTNIVDEMAAGLVAMLSQQLRAGWRAALV